MRIHPIPTRHLPETLPAALLARPANRARSVRLGAGQWAFRLPVQESRV